MLCSFLSLVLPPAKALAVAPPSRTATIVVHGFDPDGAQQNGVFGIDTQEGYITSLANSIGLPTSIAAPQATNQVAHATYYGNQYPAYYTSADIADVQAMTNQHGGGVPRYALIMAKFAKHVMNRSGADQVNIFGVSFGGLISRYMIEKDLEGLASSGKIARWISVEGVVNGNFAATWGGSVAEDFFESYYDADPIDLYHMDYQWVEDNLHDPRESSSSPLLGTIPCHFWLACDDDFNNKFLTYLSQKPNDGVVLIEDAYLRNLPAQSRYLNLAPTVSATHTTHESTKNFEGIRAGVAAQVFGRKRVRITLEQVRVRNEFDGGARGDGEYVFGVKIFSPRAQSLYNITKPVHQLRAEDNNVDYIRMAENTTRTVNLVWFDDMILPDETQLRLETNVEEIDGDYIYEILEATGESREELDNRTQLISTATPGRYTLETDDWRGIINVEIFDYPPFDSSSVNNWGLYD